MADDASRQYLTLTLGGERFALESSAIAEVLDTLPVTWVPFSPEHLRGVVNLRGNAASVVDLRRKLELGETDAAASCLVVVERDFAGETLAIAALADAVHEVVEIADRDIAPPPDMGLSVPARFVKGLARLHDAFVMVLDADRLFSLEELAARQRP
ncbi:MAG: chemotaxis protein CheW [Solidesulfovibrio sp. DCME]|uniref:chemotaxis protein CheW n=1 Tax=Solidesulfovibrio sp. DCME TaxID=3447380 RepID=UPI003D0B710E